jgi:hypothetical protein
MSDIQRRTVQIVSADHNGKTIDGNVIRPLLEGDDLYWLELAFMDGGIHVRHEPGCDYAVVDIDLSDGEKVMLTPGDTISARLDGTGLQVTKDGVTIDVR